jgi:hypothetical protein
MKHGNHIKHIKQQEESKIQTKYQFVWTRMLLFIANYVDGNQSNLKKETLFYIKQTMQCYR